MSARPWLAHYDPQVPPTLDFDESTVPELVARSIERHADATALVFRNAHVTYRELGERIERFATALSRQGVEAGTSVAVHLPNLPQTVVAYQAALRLGARVVLTNPLYTSPEIVHQWGDAECEVAVTADFLFERAIQPVRSELPVRELIVSSIADALPAPARWIAPILLRRQDPPLWARVRAEDHVHRFRELERRTPRRAPAVATDLDAVAVLQYTGGTTGVSKAAMLTHRNLSANVQQTAAWFGGDSGASEVMLASLPLFHVFGMTVSMNWGLAAGMKIVLVANPRDSEGLLDAIEKHRVTIFPAVPAMFNAINQLENARSADLSSLRVCVSGSAPISEDVLRRFEDLSGAPIVEGYGLSETSPVTHCNPVRGDRRVGWIGIPLPDTDAKIVDAEDSARELPAGEEGELLLRGPQVMRGYHGQAAETAAVLSDGWFATGDLATMSEDGYFRIVGRKKDMINCSGLKVYPDEVDAVLMAHEGILEAATIGVPNPEYVETVRSYVVTRPGTTLSVEDVKAWCAGQLAKYKVPREVEFLDELPKSSVLKVLRRELRERAIRENAASAGAD